MLEVEYRSLGYTWISCPIMVTESGCAVAEMWQNFIDECLVHIDGNVQVGFSSSL